MEGCLSSCHHTVTSVTNTRNVDRRRVGTKYLQIIKCFYLFYKWYYIAYSEIYFYVKGLNFY